MSSFFKDLEWRGLVYQATDDNLAEWLAKQPRSVYAGFDSFVGPVYLAAGFAEGGHRGIYLYLGNPFAPRPIRIFD